MHLISRHLHRILLVLIMVSVGGCELLGVLPGSGSASPRSVEIINGTTQHLYVLAFTQETLSHAGRLVHQTEVEADDPKLLAPGEVLEVDLGDAFRDGDEAVFIPYAPIGNDTYRLAAMINRSYTYLKRRSFQFRIRPGDLNQVDLEIHLTNSYEDDRVRVRVDGREVFDDHITTDYVVSLAEVVYLVGSSGSHEVEVVVNDTHSASTTIDLDEPLYVQVRFYREDIPEHGFEEGIFFDVSDERPMYD